MIRNIPAAGLIFSASLLALPNAVAQNAGTPQSRMRPIGSPSMVDQFRSSIERVDYRETTARQNQTERSQNDLPVRQAVWMHDGEAPPLLNDGGMALPNQFNAPPISPPPPVSVPRNLPVNPGASASIPSLAVPATPAQLNPVPRGDYAPLIQPRLDNQYATLGNSCHVSGPSTYSAASASGCCTPVNYQAPPASIAPPVFVPSATGIPAPTLAPVAPFSTSIPIAGAPTGVPSRSLISFGQERYPVQVGPGLFGQPVAYVPGQKFRNWIRYIFP